MYSKSRGQETCPCDFPVSQSIWAAVTEYHRLGDLKNKHLLITVTYLKKVNLVNLFIYGGWGVQDQGTDGFGV